MDCDKLSYAMGWSAGYSGLFTQLIEHRKNEKFCKGFAAGRDRSMAEHRDTSNAVFCTPQMINAEQARKWKGE